LCALFLTWLGIYIYIANFIGYILGIAISYILNSKYTFSVSLSVFQLIRFLAGVSICFLLNIAVIYMILSINNGLIYFSQICGVIVYAFTGFFINKFWALK